VIDKLIDLIVNFMDLFRFWQVINEYERGIVLRLGVFQRELEPGLHWVIPFHIDNVLHDNVVPRTVALGAQSLMTKDGVTVAVSGVVTARIRHIRKALLEVEGVDHALVDSCSAAVAEHVARATWDELRAVASGEALLKECRKQEFQYGIEILRVQLSDITTCRVVRLHVANGHNVASGKLI
jgi:regulator of protease activity HflC (stomatin/prohibitin superfamily)